MARRHSLCQWILRQADFTLHILHRTETDRLHDIPSSANRGHSQFSRDSPNKTKAKIAQVESGCSQNEGEIIPLSVKGERGGHFEGSTDRARFHRVAFGKQCTASARLIKASKRAEMQMDLGPFITHALNLLAVVSHGGREPLNQL
ncbi:hypothetical protein WMY93_026880 [Mugilogobius chulae]|uniref:Uncharacterized protein n=1 Tax=Mugilogobius chulae TaxID=88201 RepID=A0AAW0N0A6_9GOBI